MRRLLASIRKEFLLLFYDRLGLILMFALPLFLVFVITLVQDSAFRIVNENSIDVLFVNADKGELGDELLVLMKQSGHFDVEVNSEITIETIKMKTLSENKLFALYIPDNFTHNLKYKAKKISEIAFQEFGLTDNEEIDLDTTSRRPELYFFYNPILQENFQYSILNGLKSILAKLENSLLINEMYETAGYDKPTNRFSEFLENNQPIIQPQPASYNYSNLLPNSTQHNIPAWSVFAMFFIVTSLGTSIVKEKLSGNFIRLRMIPQAFAFTLLGKWVVFLIVSLLQLCLFLAVGVFIFPYINLPKLIIPNLFPLFGFSLLIAMSAISFAMLVGTFSSTQEQASGIGTISVIIFAAIGGIWVPSYVLPDFLQMIGKISPLHWCIEGYYTIFLKNAGWNGLFHSAIYLILFIFVCQVAVFLHLKKNMFI